jgi:hypothetical protein
MLWALGSHWQTDRRTQAVFEGAIIERMAGLPTTGLTGANRNGVNVPSGKTGISGNTSGPNTRQCEIAEKQTLQAVQASVVS